MKIFQLNTRQTPLWTTLLAIIGLAFIYLFIYIPRHEKMIREQRFRVLQIIDENVHSKIRNSVALLNNLLTAYERPVAIEANKYFTAKSLNEYVRKSSRENFTFTPHWSKKDNVKTDSLDNAYTLEIDEKTQEIILRYSKKYSGQNILHGIGMKFSFDQFISALLPQNVFDEYIVLSSGKTVYETFPAGVSKVMGDSVLGIKNGMSASSIRDFSIGGKDYKLFLQPVQFTSEKEWVIGGLLSDKRYQAERKQLPSGAILFLFTLAVLLIVAIPWIKLFHMGGQDRLTILDGAFSILVSMLIVSVLFLTFFKYNLPFRTDNSPDSKKNLADSISIAFKKEIDSTHKMLTKHDAILRDLKTFAQDIIYEDGAFRNMAGHMLQKPTQVLTLARDSSIKHFFWLRANGDEIFKWTRDNLMPPHANYRIRKYFKNVIEKRTYSLPSLNDTTKFYLDQVMSWTSGEFTSVLSIPSSAKNVAVAAVAFNVKSLRNTIMPLGYQFAIINKNGDVLYHSQSSHNLNENLLERFSASNELLSCLNAHSDGAFLTEYLSRKYNVLVKPFTELPYFIVILSDTAFKETRDLEIYSFTFTIMLLFYAFLIFEMLIIFLGSARRSFFKKQLFDTSWVGPKSSAHADYLLSAFFNMVVIGLLMYFFSSSSFLSYGFMLLFSVTFLTFFLNCLYWLRYCTEGSVKSVFKVTAIVILAGIITIVDLVAFLTLERRHFCYVIKYEAALSVLSLCIILLRWMYLKKWQSQTNRLRLREKNYITSFTLMVLTRLIVTSGIPVVFFYVGSYNYEQNLLIRYKQSIFANQLIEEMPPDSLAAARTIVQKPAIYIDSAWIKSIGIAKGRKNTDTNSSEDGKAIKLLSTFRPDITSEAITEEKFYLTKASDSVLSYSPIMKDGNEKDSGTFMDAKTNNPDLFLTISSAGLNYNFPFLVHNKGSWFWVFFTIALVLFFILLRTIVIKLFAIKIPDLSKFEKLDDDVLVNNDLNNLLFVLGSPGAKKKNYILEQIKFGKIRARDGSKLTYNEGMLDTNDVFIADLFNIPDSSEIETELVNWKSYAEEALNDENKLVIVNHFEYNLEDQVTNRIKLNFLEHLMMKENPKIIILSAVHPTAVLDSIFFEGKKKKGKDENVQTSISSEDLERWNILLGHFRIVLLALENFEKKYALGVFGNKAELKAENCYPDAKYFWEKVWGRENPKKPIQLETPGKSRTMAVNLVPGVYKFRLTITHRGGVSFEDKVLTVRDPIYSLTYGETQRTHFLNKMRGTTLNLARMEDKKDFNPDELAFKLQFTSQYFYMYIWQSLTKEEKFLLYDLAEDNLVNSFDVHNLSMLIGKGIIYRDSDGTLRIFNKGFRNFILTAIGNSEAMKIKSQIRDNGNWGKWRTPLIIIFISILVFLMVSEENTYGKLLLYVGGLGTAIPAFLKVLSLFDRSAPKSS
jgi:hypothetical protein